MRRRTGWQTARVRMYLYALTYGNPYEDGRPFVLFVAAERLIEEQEARASAVEAVRNDNLGNEWVEAVANGVLSGPVEIEGALRQPSIAVVVP